MGKIAPQTKINGEKLKADIKAAGYTMDYLAIESGHSKNYISQSVRSGSIATNTLRYVCEIIDSLPEAYEVTKRAQRAVEEAVAKQEETRANFERDVEVVMSALREEVERLRAEVEDLKILAKNHDNELSTIIRRLFVRG